METGLKFFDFLSNVFGGRTKKLLDSNEQVQEAQSKALTILTEQMDKLAESNKWLRESNQSIEDKLDEARKELIALDNKVDRITNEASYLWTHKCNKTHCKNRIPSISELEKSNPYSIEKNTNTKES